jgi:uncharacterized Zn finger protein
MGWDDYYGYKPYVPVAQRRAQAAQEAARRARKGEKLSPVKIEGRTIASTFWGKAWCTNLESYSDFANRLPRGRTYVRNGSVIDLKIEKGRINALVYGSELYKIQIDIEPLPKARWQALKNQCAGQIASLVELLQGRLSRGVMERVTDRKDGLFPAPAEIEMECSCPDYAGMCKHVAAVMYGIGSRLDSSPELLFLLRGVDHLELIEQAIPAAPSNAGSGSPAIASEDLGDIFGIEVDAGPDPIHRPSAAEKTPRKKAPRAAVAAKPADTKTAAKPKAAARPKATAKSKATTEKKVTTVKEAAAKPKTRSPRKRG